MPTVPRKIAPENPRAPSSARVDPTPEERATQEKSEPDKRGSGHARSCVQKARWAENGTATAPPSSP